MSGQMDGYTRTLIEKLGQIGPERITVAAQLVKLQDEVAEVLEEFRYLGEDLADNEDLLRELADVVIVCHTAAYLLGYGSDALMLEVLDKAKINAAREWYPIASGTARHTPEEAR